MLFRESPPQLLFQSIIVIFFFFYFGSQKLKYSWKTNMRMRGNQKFLYMRHMRKKILNHKNFNQMKGNFCFKKMSFEEKKQQQQQ